MKKKLSLFYYFHLIAWSLYCILSLSFLGLSYYNIKQRFNQEVTILQTSYLEKQKTILKNEVDRFIDSIAQQRQSAYAQTQALARARVYEAYDVAMQIYTHEKNHLSEAALQKKIIETLRLMRYDEGKGYYFITRMDGIEMLFTDHPEMEGRDMLRMVNGEGRCIVRGMIDIVQSMKEGYYEFMWSKPFVQGEHKKIAYVKAFEPFGWLIGTGYYIDDMSAKIQARIINDEKSLHFSQEREGYLFIGQWDGFSLSYPAKNKNMRDIQDANGKYVVKELIAAAKNGGGYVEYMMPALKNEVPKIKLSYVRSYDDWQWYIGAGMYLDDVKKDVQVLEESMRENLKRAFYTLLLWTVLFSVIVWVLYLFVNRRVRKDFATFTTFFDSLANSDKYMDASALKFREFEELAHHANAMLSVKIDNKKHLERYKKIVSSSEDFLAFVDRNYTYLAVSEAYMTFFDQKKETIVNHTIPQLVGQQYFEEVLKPFSDRALNGENFESEFWINSVKNGSRFLHAKYFPYYENESDELPIAYVFSARDNTEKKESEERLLASEKELEFLAHNDVLTGLPNRILLNDRLSHAIDNAKRQGKMIAVCFIDLDNFKKINDSFGHSYGDAVLQQFTERIQKQIRRCDTLSRIGGDEFILVIENISDEYEIDVILQKIQTIFETPFINKDQKFFLSASIGVSLYPDHGTDGETLIKNADAAMYRAKENGKNCYAFYTLEMTVASYERIGMENALREAVKEQQFLVYYQPQIDLKTQKLIGLEALVRWNHPIEGVMAPGRFIHYAEETHLIIEIGAWVLRQSCLDWHSLHKEGLFEGTISVNISGVQIEFTDFMATLRNVLEETKIDPSMIEMEVTESFIMRDPERWIQLLKQMQKLGLHIAIDDFGTGYSSLSYLRKLPIDKLKVDMSFVKDIPHLEDACAIVKSIIDLAENMNITTLAEGIEELAQERYLAQHGCLQGQGYLYAKPMSLKELRTWIKNRS